MASIWEELKRRNVVKVAMAYAIVGWILIEISATVFPIVRLPDWTVTFVTMLVLLGFPVALILSWAFELTPDGLKPSNEVEPSASITNVTGQKLNYAIIGVLVIAVGFLLFKVYLPQDSGQEDIVQEDPTAKTGPIADIPELAVQGEQRYVLPNSVAVLPFENLSLDPEDGFFAIGIHDELLNQLAKIRDLNVIARTSVLRYAETEMPIAEIAAELNVGNIMEGTVRYAEGSVRVTTQLIDATTGAHLWSETYTRPFENIFEIETDIATQIAMALEAEFSTEERRRIENTSILTSSEAFALYVRAKELRNANAPVPEILSSVQADLERAIALDPGFAQPHAMLATIHAEQTFADIGTPDNWRSRGAELERLAVEHAQNALELDPNLGYAWSGLGKMYLYQWRGKEARAAHEKAMAISPNDAWVLIEAAWLNFYALRNDEALRLAERAVQLDPNNGDMLVRLSIILNSVQEDERTLALIHQAIRDFPTNPITRMWLSFIEAAQGRQTQALAEVKIAEQLAGDTRSGFTLGLLAYAYALSGSAEDASRTVGRMETVAKAHRVGDLSWALAHMAVGDHEQALAVLNRVAEEKNLDEGTLTTGWIVNNVFHDAVLEQPEFVEVRKRLALTDL